MSLARNNSESIVETWMDIDESARVVLDDDLTLYWISASAEALFKEDRTVDRRNGHLTPKDARTARELRKLVAEASEQVSTQCIADPGTDEHIVISARRLVDPWRHLVGVTLRVTGPEFHFELADLREAFGLTPCERRVTSNLVAGHTAEQTATVLEISLDTVRTHIKRVYAKLGVSSREGFFRKLAPFMVVH
jgi:DNA-binding CsgD family transcriptional regulator